MGMFTEVASALTRRLSEIPGIEQVHAYPRWATDATTFLSKFAVVEEGRYVVRAWALEGPETEFEPGGYENSIAGPLVYTVSGWHSIDDEAASYPAFIDLIESVVMECNSQWDLGRPEALRVGPANIARIEPLVMLGSVACHYVEIRLPVLVELDIEWRG